MNFMIKAALSASALLVASQAQATDFFINSSTTGVYTDHSQPSGLGYSTDPFYVDFITPTFISAIINPVRPAAGSFTDTFTFILPFTGFGTGSVTSALISGVDLVTAKLEIFDGGLASTTVVETINGTRTTSGVQVSIGADSGIPAGKKVVLTISGTANGLNSYNGNLTANAVPEPATWAMLLVGFGAVGYAMRRRREQSVKVSYA